METSAIGSTIQWATGTRRRSIIDPQPAIRPLPLRTYSEFTQAAIQIEPLSNGHRKRRSIHTPNQLDLSRSSKARHENPQPIEVAVNHSLHSLNSSPHAVKQHYIDHKDTLAAQSRAANQTPPITPMSDSERSIEHSDQAKDDLLYYDFSKIDYEIERSNVIGRGLWSDVYLVHPVVQTSDHESVAEATPPSTPDSGPKTVQCYKYAVKVPNGGSAKRIFAQEARILTKLQYRDDYSRYIVPFYGFDQRNSALVFEGVDSGRSKDPSLDGFVGRLTTTTELERHLELKDVLIGLSRGLIDGLRFIHAAGVIHADIKPANILLDTSDTNSLGHATVRSRYIDFSASFCSGSPASNAGGTWDFMAPEQLRVQKELNTPTFASDIWSLGITLLFVLVGGSPYRELCGDNLFMLRDTIKKGRPLENAMVNPRVRKRMATCQDFVDCCRQALQADRDSRLSAGAWLEWLEKRCPTEYQGIRVPKRPRMSSSMSSPGRLLHLADQLP